MDKQYTVKSFFATALICIMCISIGKAQFSFSPSTTILKNQVLNLMTYDSLHISNTSSDTIHLNWELISYDTLSGTYFDFCSSGNCWLGVPDSGSFPPIEPGGFGWAGAHFWTGNVAVTCSTRIRIYDENNPIASDTITFVLNAITNGIIHYDAFIQQTTAFPNPTHNTITVNIAEGEQVYTTVYNADGKAVLEAGSNNLSLRSLPAGTYFITVRTGSGNNYSTIIQKINN